MNALANVLRRTPRVIHGSTARAAIKTMTYELVPVKSLDAQMNHLPDNARVAVTASPVRPLEDTLDAAAGLIDRGHRPVPHLAARMVRDESHLRQIAARLKALGISEIFCIGGDSDDPGRYPDALSFLAALLQVASGDITAVGVAGYPDGHAFIDAGDLRRALVEKQELFAEAGVKGHMTTQICFSTATIRTWLERERADGITLPVHLGVPGVVDRARLMSMGLRLGVGASLRYLKKNSSGLVRLFASPGYNPGDLIGPLARDFDRLEISGIHVFTFNQVKATRQWQQAALG